MSLHLLARPPGVAAALRRHWHALVIAGVGVSLLLLQLLVFRGDPVTTDENAYLFQARLFASGRLWAPPPPEGSLRQFDFSMLNLTEDRWFSRYFFGHPLALVPGVLVGYPHGVPLVFALASLLLVGALARHCYNEATARVATVLLGLSPFFLAMHATLLSHTTALVTLALFALGAVKAWGSARVGWAIVAGASLGLAANTRPWTCVLMAWPFLAWGAWRWLTSPSRQLGRQLMVMSGVAGVFVVAYGLYNSLLTGLWWVTPYALYNSSERLGFVYVRMMEMQHTPWGGVENTLANLSRLNHWWLGVPGSLGLLAPLLLRRLEPIDRVWLLSALSLVVGYYFFYFQGISTVGPVYYFELLLPLSLLGARAVMVLWEGTRWRREVPATLRRAVLLCGVPIWLGALGVFWWHRVPALQEVLAPQRRLQAAVTREVVDGAIVFLGGRGRPEWRAVAYDPREASRLVYMWTRDDRYARIMELYPGRPAYLYVDGTLTRLR